MGLAAVVLGAGMAFVCAATAYLEYRRTHELLSPLILFCALAIADIYLPAVIFGFVGPPDLAPWLSLEAVGPQIPWALLVFTAAVVLFVAGYALAHRLFRTSQSPTFIKTSVPTAIVLLLMTSAWWFWSAAVRSGFLGSIEAFIAARLAIRWIPLPLSVQYPGLPYVAVAALEISSLLLPVIGMLTAVLLFTRKHPIGIAPLVLLAVVVSFSTFFRGAILLYFVSLAAVVELVGIGVMRRHLNSERSRHAEAALLCVVGVALFLGYGVVRNSFTLNAEEAARTVAASPTPPSQSPDSPSVVPHSQPPISTATPEMVPLVAVTGEGAATEVERIVRGEGLIGLSAILAYFPARHPFLEGKTIHDMLLLPMPRSIWPEKPEWYGVSDITRAYGEPTGTQSAVTMPGELYANFGLPGLLGMLLYGLFFGIVHVYRYGTRRSFLYAFVLMPLVVGCFWMGFTGFVNAFLSAPIGAAVVLLVFPGKRLGSWFGRVSNARRRLGEALARRVHASLTPS